MSVSPSIELSELSLFFHKKPVLNQLSLVFPAGKTTAIVGPNGSGKSTLIKTLLGQHQHQGTIAINWPDKAHQNIAYLPQFIDFDRELPLNAYDLLAVVLQNRPVFAGLNRHTRQISNQLLQQVGLYHKRYSKIGKLSGGELKRLLLAQTLYPEPQLILLDEPLAALDQTGIELFYQQLATWQAQEKTILWVEHDLLAISEHAHHLVAINQRLLYEGATHQLDDKDFLLQLYSHHQKYSHA